MPTKRTNIDGPIETQLQLPIGEGIGPVVVDLFAGCGGLSLGMEQAGFRSIYVNELDPDARDSYLLNRSYLSNGSDLRSRFNSSDIKSLTTNNGDKLEELRIGFNSLGIGDGEIDLVTGGPPCQGFSGIGYRRSYAVDKHQLPSNHLFQDMAYVIAQLKPKMFLFENVKGLLTARWRDGGDKGEIWERVKEAFAAIPGYQTRHALLRAGQYGVPQNRPRIMLVGIREDIAQMNWTPNPDLIADGLLPEAHENPAPDLIDVLGDLVDDNPNNWKGGVTSSYPSPATSTIQKYFRRKVTGKLARKGDPITEHEYTKHSDKIYQKFEIMQGTGGDIPPEMKTRKFAQRLLPQRWRNGRPTITATSLPDDFVHFSQPRILTVREWARLQTFPDWYQFCGKRTTGGTRRAGNPRCGLYERELPKYTQIGNAVPVLLAKAIGAHFRKLIANGE